MGRLRFSAAALVVGVLMLGTGLLDAGLLSAGLLRAGPLSSVAQAQSQAQQNRARQLYGEAQALFDSGRYAAAEASFRAAYDAVPNPVVLRAIAASQERQGNIAQAVATLQQYLRDAPDASDRAEVERRVQELSARPATLAVSSTPAGAQIIVDGQDTGLVTPADLTLPAGEHTLELQLEGHQPATQTVTAQAATRMRLEVPLQAGAAAADALGSEGGDGQAAVEDPGTSSSEPSAGVWVTAGIAAAALVSGTVFGFLALSEQSNFDSMPTNDTADRGEIFALVADISFGVAAAAAITAIVLYIVERSGGSSDTETASNELELEVAPWADASGGGMAAQLRF